MNSGNLPILLVFLGTGVAIGFLLAQRAYLSADQRRWWSGGALAAAMLCLVSLLPALAMTNQALTLRSEIEWPTEQELKGLGGQFSDQTYAFSLNFGSDDVVWFSAPPTTSTEPLKDKSEIPSNAVLLDTIEVYKYESNSHCYPIIVGGKPTTFCPQH